jgi:hypothetical protein
MKKKETAFKTIFLTLILCSCFIYAAFGDGDKAKVVHISGEASLIGNTAHKSTELIENAVIERGDTITTGSGRVFLENGNSAIKVKLYRNSEIIYQGKDANNTETFKLKKGRAYFEIVPGNKLDIQTPHVLASVRGTSFTLVISETETMLSVYSGSVMVKDNEGKNTLISKGGKIKANKKSIFHKKTEKNHMKENNKNNHKKSRKEKKENNKQDKKNNSQKYKGD